MDLHASPKASAQVSCPPGSSDLELSGKEAGKGNKRKDNEESQDPTYKLRPPTQ